MKKVTVLLILLVFSCLAFANSPATSGFQFLKMQVSARAAAMGGSFVAIPGDVNALFYNPAGIVAVSQKAATFSYQDDLLDLNSGFIGYVHPQVGPGNIGVSVLYRDYGNFTKTDISGQELGDFGANSIALTGSYGIEAMPNLYAGGSLKYVRGAIDTYSADAVAVDAGVMYRIPQHELVLAAVVSNVGTSLNAYIAEKPELPMQVRAGFSKRLAHLPLLFGVNVYKFSDSPWYATLGGEFTITPNLFLRVGWDSFGRDLEVDSSKDTLAGVATGLGFFWNNLTFDYSYSSLGALGALNRFTISGHF